MNNGLQTASRLASETGSGSITSAIIAIAPHGRQPAIMDGVPDTPDPQTRTEVTQRIIAHVTRGWPHLGEPIVRYRGRYCYVSARLPGEREPAPILRLRYQGSAVHWAIGIYLASTDRYTESELPTSLGPKTGTPEEAVDDTFILYLGSAADVVE